MMVFVRQLFKGTRKDAPAVQTLGLPDKDLTTKPSEDMSAGISPELAKEAARRIKAAAEMGDVTELISIAEALKKRSESYEPISNRIIQLAEDFDFDGILQLAGDLDG